MVIDTTINLGNIIVAVGGIVTIAVAFMRLDSSIKVMNVRLKGVEEKIEPHANLVTEVALIKERQTANTLQIGVINKELSDLRRGEGFIRKTRAQGGIDGEYP